LAYPDYSTFAFHVCLYGIHYIAQKPYKSYIAYSDVKLHMKFKKSNST